MYTVRCGGVDSGFEGTMEDTRFTPRTFSYALRAGASWRNGRVGKLDVTIDMTFLRLSQFKINIEPKPQTQGAGISRWSFIDFDLKNAPDFVCTYDATPA